MRSWALAFHDSIWSAPVLACQAGPLRSFTTFCILWLSSKSSSVPQPWRVARDPEEGSRFTDEETKSWRSEVHNVTESRILLGVEEISLLLAPESPRGGEHQPGTKHSLKGTTSTGKPSVITPPPQKKNPWLLCGHQITLGKYLLLQPCFPGSGLSVSCGPCIPTRLPPHLKFGPSSPMGPGRVPAGLRSGAVFPELKRRCGSPCPLPHSL